MINSRNKPPKGSIRSAFIQPGEAETKKFANIPVRPQPNNHAPSCAHDPKNLRHHVQDFRGKGLVPARIPPPSAMAAVAVYLKSQRLDQLPLVDEPIAIAIDLVEGGRRLGGNLPALLMMGTAKLLQHPVFLSIEETVPGGVVHAEGQRLGVGNGRGKQTQRRTDQQRTARLRESIRSIHSDAHGCPSSFLR